MSQYERLGQALNQLHSVSSGQALAPNARARRIVYILTDAGGPRKLVRRYRTSAGAMSFICVPPLSVRPCWYVQAAVRHVLDMMATA